MASHRTSNRCLLLAAICLAGPQSASAGLTCQQPETDGLEVSISYSDTREYSRFEFTPANSDAPWVGIVFEFFGTAPTNTLLKDISPSLKGKALSEQFTRSFMAHLEEQMPYDGMSDMQFHELDGRFVTTFDTLFDERRDLRAIYGQWDGEDFQFFRVLVPAGESDESSEEVALEAMRQMIRNCLHHEA